MPTIDPGKGLRATHHETTKTEPSSGPVCRQALRKLAGPHVPASLTKLEQAVKRAHAAYDKAERNARERQRAQAAPDVQGDDQDGAEAA